MGKRSVPAAAGILMLIAGIFNVFWLIGVFTHVLDVKALLRATAVISPFPYLILDVGFGGNNLNAFAAGVNFSAPAIVLSIVGGWLTLKRKSRSMALAGAAGACVAAPLAGIVAVVIIL